MILHPRFALVANPARLARKHERGLAFEREQDVHVAVHDLESRHVEHRAFEPRILVSAHQQGIQIFLGHARAHVPVPTLDFFLTWQR
jgi:hypothetical protein